MEVHGRKHALLEEDHVLFFQAEVFVFGEESFGGFHRPAAGHDVPEIQKGDKCIDLSLNIVFLHFSGNNRDSRHSFITRATNKHNHG